MDARERIVERVKAVGMPLSLGETEVLMEAHAKEARAEGFKSGLMTAKNCWAPDWPDYLDNLQRKADNRDRGDRP